MFPAGTINLAPLPNRTLKLVTRLRLIATVRAMSADDFRTLPSDTLLKFQRALRGIESTSLPLLTLARVNPVNFDAEYALRLPRLRGDIKDYCDFMCNLIHSGIIGQDAVALQEATEAIRFRWLSTEMADHRAGPEGKFDCSSCSRNHRVEHLAFIASLATGTLIAMEDTAMDKEATNLPHPSNAAPADVLHVRTIQFQELMTTLDAIPGLAEKILEKAGSGSYNDHTQAKRPYPS